MSSLRGRADVIACLGTLVGCLLLGGGTRAGFLGDVVLQLLSIPVLLLWCWRLAIGARQDGTGVPLLFCIAVLLVPLFQLLPLPPALWARLPGHEIIAETMRLTGGATAYMPISVSSTATWIGFLSLLPPLAVFVGVLRLDLADRRILTLLVIAFAIGSALLGLLQVAQGKESALRPFTITNPSEAVGLFANRNHFAALLYCAILLVAAWGVQAAQPLQSDRRIEFDSAWIVPLTACLVALVVLVAAATMARSRAGLGLAMAALAGGVAMTVAARKREEVSFNPTRAMAGATLFAVLFAVQFGLYRVLERFGGDPFEDARVRFAHNTIAAARTFMPFGSGVGTFVPAYAMHEKAADALPDTYANRAHNDILELWLEAGLLGIALMLAFTAWIAVQSYKHWRHPSPQTHAIDVALARAATLMLALLLAHSVVDYPLRTTAMAALMAMACGLLIPPATWPRDETAREAGSGKHLRHRVDAKAAAPAAGAAARPAFPQTTWPVDEQRPPVRPVVSAREEMVWPDAWQRGKKKPVDQAPPGDDQRSA